ncbi:pregnancy-specific beta-1-glycoprotein 4-like [Myripristis murdjan]|uniref:pregnancy-specific beta-1-glycoprotein 4-like n=1 Tax=Myripristis murdjan TaxID=586833 RepID=UPI0011760C19|nr:pregnancy-specific beta-1-glycoprotein 4-like [Myripristis murdjan]
MSLILICRLLGVTALVVQVAISKEAPEVTVSVWPPGSNIYPGECMLLRCSVVSGSRSVWTYQWFRNKPHMALTPNPRHLASHDSYSITGVTREDGGSYWCQVERRGSNSTTVLLSDPARLTVSELAPPSLTVTPSSRQIFRGERLTVQCPVSGTNSSGWALRQLSQDFGLRTADFQTGQCTPLEGAVSADVPDACIFPTVYSGNSGLYWCERAGGRSNAVNITVSYGTIIMKTPVHSVPEGEQVVLYCQYWKGNHSKTTFFKDGVEVHTSLSPDRVVEMTIDNVTKEDEGFYKCASHGRKMESPASWLSVGSNSTSANGTPISNHGSRKWIILSCCLVGLLFLIPLIVWVVHHYRYQICRTRNCWPISKEELPTVELPKTKQDVTEVQWDLSWMEMSNLLDKQLYPIS